MISKEVEKTVCAADQSRKLARRNVLKAFAAMGVVSAAPYYAKAANVNTGAGDIRKISMRNDRTGELLDMVYWVDGQYIPESLRAVNYFFRDWRENAVINVDPHEADIIAAAHRVLNTSEPFLLISGYRTPRTNRIIHGAKHSYHTKGQAADLRLRSRSVKQMASAARRINAGGVGTYYRSNFIHMDSGPIRSWRG